jgi:hypothetical protein
MNYTVQVIFYDGTNTYTFPVVQDVDDPNPGSKATVIEGNRSDGSIIIPGGKKSPEIVVKGVLNAADYLALTTLMDDMRSKVTTLPATLTIRYWNGATWVNSRVWNVQRTQEIKFGESLRTGDIDYTVTLLVRSF